MSLILLNLAGEDCVEDLSVLEEVATLYMDATLIETVKEEELYSYKRFKSYHPLNVWWAEQEMVLHTEFLDGNVPAGHKKLRILKEALAHF